jgi:hypothetical protein
MTIVALKLLTLFVVAMIWASALRRARKMLNFDRSAGRFTVYVWHISVALFWTLVVAIACLPLLAFRIPNV